MIECNQTDESCIYKEFLDAGIERPWWVRVVFSTIMYSIFVAGVAGNLVTCIVIYCDKSMHTTTNYYLFNLAISDLLVAFGIVLEVHFFTNYSIQYHEYGDVVCKINFFVVVAFWYNSILIVTALTIERYIAVCHPLLLDARPVLRVMRVIAIIWTLSIIAALSETWAVRFVSIGSYGLCAIMPTILAKWLNAIMGLVTFVIPLFTMVFVYTTVAFKVISSEKKYQRDLIFNRQNNSGKINKLIIALTLSFLICWLPYFMVRVAIVFTSGSKIEYLMKCWDLLVMLIVLTSWLPIVLNPLLFSLMSTKFRKAFAVRLKGCYNVPFFKNG